MRHGLSAFILIVTVIFRCLFCFGHLAYFCSHGISAAMASIYFILVVNDAHCTLGQSCQDLGRVTNVWIMG